MAIVLNSTPASYSSFNGDILFTAYESVKANDPVTYPNYKYVCDVYIGGSMIFRAKAFPNPVNKRGVFNIAPIVRSYIATQFHPTASGILAQQFGANEFYLDIQCKFGEEYSFTTYTNLTIDSTRRYYNHYNSQLYNSTTILPNYVDHLATNRPYSNSLLYNSAGYYVPYFSVSGTLVVSVTAYNPTSAHILTTDGEFILIEGRRLSLAGSPSYTTSTGSITLSPTAGSLQELNLCPSAINHDIPGMISSSTLFYIVTINGSDQLLFVITDECIHTPYTIHFMNQLGGFESVDFRKLSRKTYDIEKKTYVQQPFRMDGSGNMYYTYFTTVNESLTTYASQYKEKLKLSTDFLQDGDWSWLRELQFSPLVYLAKNGFLFPVSVSGNGYEEKKYVNDRKVSAMIIDIEYGVQLNAQYR
jgi:hypothetical protein